MSDRDQLRLIFEADMRRADRTAYLLDKRDNSFVYRHFVLIFAVGIAAMLVGVIGALWAASHYDPTTSASIPPVLSFVGLGVAGVLTLLFASARGATKTAWGAWLRVAGVLGEVAIVMVAIYGFIGLLTLM